MQSLWLPAGLIALAIILIICGPTRLVDLAVVIFSSARGLLARLRQRNGAARPIAKPNRPNSTPRR